MRRLITILCHVACSAPSWLLAQGNQANLTYTAPVTYTVVDMDFRATNSIKLLPPGYKCGVHSGTNKTVNYAISSYPYYVNNNYSDPLTDPTFTNVNPGLEVGTTSGNPSVDQIGGFNYSIPILCSPGTQGIAPGIAISFNSNSGSSWLGAGMSLSGISAITRTGKSVFYDDKNSGINFSGYEYALNGSRLLFVSLNTYETEVKNHHLITSHGTFGSGPSYFKVVSPDGVTMEFGNTSNSKYTDFLGTEVITWYINKLTDRFGNYILFNYSKYDGEPVIESIEYTGNTGASLSPYNKIVFQHMDRSDNASQYISGLKFSKGKLIKRVTSKGVSDAVLRDYILDYRFSTSSLLSKITEVDSKGNQLNPTHFDWLESQIDHDNVVSQSFGSGVCTTTVSNIMLSVAADLNADGKQDLLTLRNDNRCSSSPTQSTIYDVFLSSNSTTTVSLSHTTWGTFWTTGDLPEIIASNVFDEDHDGFEEVFITFTFPLSSDYGVKKIKTTNGTTFNITLEHSADRDPPSMPFLHWRANSYQYLSHLSQVNRIGHSSYLYTKCDLSGDGQLDLLICDQNGVFITPSESGSGTFSIALTDIIKTKTADYNADGIMDLFVLRRQHALNDHPLELYQVDVYSYDVLGNQLQTLFTKNNIAVDVSVANSPSLPENVLDYYRLGAPLFDIGDVNGDGSSDILIIDRNLGIPGWYDPKIIFSNGSSSTPSSTLTLVGIPSTISSFEAYYSLSDVNGDGLADLCGTAFDTANHVAYYAVHESIGTRFAFNTYTFSTSANIISALGDFNGDGDIDLLSQNDNVKKLHFNVFNTKRRNLITRIWNIKDDLRVSYHKLTVKKAIGGSLFYQKSTVASGSAYRSRIFPLFVVTDLQLNYSKQSYGYENLLYNNQGKGIVGFEKTYTQNKSISPVTMGSSSYYRGSITSHTFDSNFDAVAVTEAFSRELKSDNIFLTNTSSPQISNWANTVLTYSVTSSVIPLRQLNTVESKSRDYLSSTFSKEITHFDHTSGGKPLSVTVAKRNWDDLSSINTRVVSYTYQPLTLSGGQTYYEKQSEIAVTTCTLTNYSAFRTDYGFDASGRCTTKVENANLGRDITTTYSGFNSFGSPTTISVSAADLAQPRTKQILFDTRGRFTTKITNSLGDYEEFVFDELTGNVLETKDLSGLVTKYDYNGLGKLISTQYPSGVINTQDYVWYSYTDNRISTVQAVYAEKVQGNSDESGDFAFFFDVSGNLVKTETKGFGGTTVSSEIAYDALNRKQSVTDNHFNGQADYRGVKYEYDIFSRVSRVASIIPSQSSTISTTDSYYNSMSTNSTYNKGFVKAVVSTLGSSGTYTHTNEHNAAGQTDVIRNIANGTTVSASYILNDLGQPLQITVSSPGVNSAVTFIDYDVLRRRSQLSDPSAGIHNYHYNSVGELTVTTFPGGTYNYTYDQLGRILTKDVSGVGTYSYQYVTGTNGKEKLWKIVGPEVTTELTYDALGRVVKKQEDITTGSTKQFVAEYSYDRFNRLIDYKYPGGFQTTNHYDAYGNLSKIKSGSTTIWELIAMGTPNIVSQYQTRNGAQTNDIIYDANFNVHEVHSGTVALQTYSTHAASGNLLCQFYDNYSSSPTISNNEHYEYDDFDRLTKTLFENTPGNFTTKHTFNYLANGNISSKSDCGNYSYTLTSQPYDLTNFTSTVTNNISLNTLSFTYNALHRVENISEIIPGSGKTFDFDYGNNEKRIRMIYRISGTTQYTRYYLDNFDRQETGSSYKEWNYVYSPTGLVAVNYNNNGTSQLLYITCDRLGSPIMVTSSTGSIVAEYSYDAWGRRRNPADWNSYGGFTPADILIRGYTGHEHIDEIGIINMNARLYDPVLGRFLQTDDYVQAPDNLQNHNRFSYVWNNPLKYTDPSGKWVGALIGGVVGAYFGGVIANQGELNPIAWNWVDKGCAATYAGIVGGALVGAFAGHITEAAILGEIGVEFGVLTPLGVVGISGSSTGWDFTWTGRGGGGGTIPLGGSSSGNSGSIDWSAVNESRNLTLSENYSSSSSDPDLAVSSNPDMSFPSFQTLWSNYPHDVDGEHAHPSSDQYDDQCAVRVGYAYKNSGVDMSSYPEVDKTKDGYPRTAKNLADWTWQHFGKPEIMSQQSFEAKYGASTGLIYFVPSSSSPSHIDLYSYGLTGSGYYYGATVWYWPIK
jgi:RHS repeat-associated protein